MMRDLLAGTGLSAWVLPALLTWPVVGAALVLLLAVPRADDADGADGADVISGGRDTTADTIRTPRVLATAVLIGEAVLALGLWTIFDPTAATWQARFDLPWIPAWGARISLGVDGLSLVMVMLTALLMPVAVIGSWRSVRERPASYYALLLALTTGIMGVFVARDLLFFYLCWELVLIPMYFMIGISGTGERSAASLQYFIVATLGSLLMLAAIVALWSAAGQHGFDIDQTIAAARGAMSFSEQRWLFLGFFAALAIKSAYFPLHSWLPAAQRSAPTSAAVALGIKVGTYGMIRFALPLFPAAALDPTLRITIIGVAVAGILYGALVASVQPDLRRLASYASVSHLGFVVLGIFALTAESLQGAMLVMLSHGISLGALFVLAGILEDRTGTSALDRFGGLARTLPVFAVAMVVVALSALGLPGTNGFVGEFLVLLGAFRNFPGLTLIATVGVILAAVYLLGALQRVLFTARREPSAEVPDGESRTMRVADLDARELTALAAFTVAIVWLGVAPAPVLRRMEGPVRRIVDQVQSGAMPRAVTAALAPSRPRPLVP